MERIRLNVSCILSEDSTPVDKFLVVVDPRQGMVTLMSKIQFGLSSKTDQITRVLNDTGSILPLDEAIGDMVRDGDEITAVVGPQAGGLLIKASKEYLDGPKSPKFKCDAPPFEPIPLPEDFKAPPKLTIEDLEPYKLYDSDINNWVVAKLTPKIREFILARFHAAFVTKPKYVPSIKKFVGAKFYQASGSFISVFMKPRNRRGEKDSPIQYNVTKVDIREFQRLVEKNIDAIQIHVDHLEATKDSLLGLLAQGMSETDHVNAMLPYKYETWDQVEGVECSEILVPALSGRCPIIIVDPHGLKNRLPFLKSSLKRCIHAHLPNKTSFLMLAIGNDKILEFASDMCVPSLTALRDVDEFLESLSCLATCSTQSIFEAIERALCFASCDAITFIGGAIGLTDLVANAALLHNLWLAQKAHAAHRKIDVIAVDADSVGELLLRNMAEKSGGKFTMKRFHGVTAFDVGKTDEVWDGVKTRIMADKWQRLAPNKDQHRLTVGGQINIVDIMILEEQQRDEFWKAEWACAKQLLNSSPTDGSTSTKAQLKVDIRSTKHFRAKKKRDVHSVRIGGGYLYQADEYAVDYLPTPGRNPWEKPPRKIDTADRMSARNVRVASSALQGVRTSASSTTSATRTSSVPARASRAAAHDAATHSTTTSRPSSRSRSVPPCRPMAPSTGAPRRPKGSFSARSRGAAEAPGVPRASPWAPSERRVVAKGGTATETKALSSSRMPHTVQASEAGAWRPHSVKGSQARVKSAVAMPMTKHAVGAPLLSATLGSRTPRQRQPTQLKRSWSL